MKLALAGLAVAAVLVVSGGAEAACPVVVWRHVQYEVQRTDARPGPPIYERRIARTAKLDLECAYIPGWRPRPVNVYALPDVDPRVAIRIEGVTFKWAIYVRYGWRIRTGTPLWKAIHHR